jgi:hypothetical protein
VRAIRSVGSTAWGWACASAADGIVTVTFERDDGDRTDPSHLDTPLDRHADTLRDFGVGRVPAKGGRQGAATVRDGPRGVPARPPDGIESADRIKDRAPDTQDGVRLERGTTVRPVSVARREQTQHPGLHRVIFIEDAQDAGAESMDDVPNEVAVLVEDDGAVLVCGRCGRHRHATSVGPGDRLRSTRSRPPALATYSASSARWIQSLADSRSSALV